MAGSDSWNVNVGNVTFDHICFCAEFADLCYMLAHTLLLLWHVMQCNISYTQKQTHSHNKFTV